MPRAEIVQLRVLIANERRDRLELVAPLVAETAMNKFAVSTLLVCCFLPVPASGHEF